MRSRWIPEDQVDRELLGRLAELGRKAFTQDPPPDPERLEWVVIEPDL